MGSKSFKNVFRSWFAQFASSMHKAILRVKMLINAWRARMGKADVFANTSDINHQHGKGDLNKLSAFYKEWFHDSIIGYGSLIAFLCFIIALFLGPDVGAENRWTEFWGLIFDLVVIVIVLGLFQKSQEKRLVIARQLETIEDYKRWDSDEAVFRIAGAIRRLNKFGVTQIDLSGAQLQNFHFSAFGIESIRGSVLSGGHSLEPYAKSKFTNCDFSGINCEGVRFSRNYLNIIGQGEYVDCGFHSSPALGDNLFSNANFEGATLKWTRPPIEDIFQHDGYNEDGSPILIQDVFTSFIGTNISSISFFRCTFLNADFRSCSGVLSANFRGAKGLETCKFDSEELKAAVIKKAVKRKITKKVITND